MKYIVLAAALVLTGVLGGCATSPTYAPADAPEMAVVKDFTPFYSRGPQQIQGPDASLRTGDRVLLLRKEFGFSYVQLSDGRTGFVPNENISVPPAPPIQKPKPQTPAPKKPEPGPRTPASGLPPDLDDQSLPDFRILPEEFPPAILLDETDEPKKPDFRL